MTSAIAIKGISKHYGALEALDDVSLNIHEGGVINGGILSTNRIGKPDCGERRTDGNSVADVDIQLGFSYGLELDLSR